jgi:hypothetical protein
MRVKARLRAAAATVALAETTSAAAVRDVASKRSFACWLIA